VRRGILVFATGAGVLALELLAARWLAPGFGVTLTTWSWVIAVTLGAGSVGAWAGGATRRPPVAALLLVAGAWVAASALVASHAVDALTGLPTTWGAGVAALAVLAVPVLALSAVLPRVLREAEPAHAGPLLAVSTLGALVGTLATGLWLIPDAGLRATGFALAGLLLLAALLAARTGASRAAAGLLLCVLGVAGLVGSSSAGAGPGVERESWWGRVTLEEGPLGLTLRVDGIAQGDVERGGLPAGTLLARGDAAELLPYLHPRATRALQVGLGAGGTARLLARHGLAVTTIEANPDIAALASTHLRASGRVLVGDGRAVWRRLDERFDVVVLDAFQGEGLASHLLTREAFTELRGLLAPGGIVAVHLLGWPQDRVPGAVAATLRASFPEQLAVRATAGDGFQPLFLFGSDLPLRVPPHPDLVAAGWSEARLFTPARDVVVLTDDHNPLDAWNEPAARTLRARQTRPRRDAAR
jgi:SAM-dependent methyltransferase